MSQARKTLQDWCRDRIAETLAMNEPINAPTLARLAADHFKDDAEWCADYLATTLVGVTYPIVRQAINETRGRYVEVGDEFIPREQVGDKARALTAPALRRTAWEAWVENVRNGVDKPLLSMTRDDLAEAAVAREKRAAADIETARLWRRLAEKMKPTETVADRYTAEQIEAIKTELDRDRENLPQAAD